MQKNEPAHDGQRQRILDAAASVFLEHGFEQANTAEIAGRAKLSKRELYIHFEDKHALLRAVILSHQSVLGQDMGALLASSEPIETVLAAAATAIRSFMLTEQFSKMMRLVSAASFHSPNLAKEFYETGPGRGRKEIARFLRKRMKAGEIRRADPVKASDDFLNLVLGAHLTTAAVLGLTDSLRRNRGDVRHALAVFLELYQPQQCR